MKYQVLTEETMVLGLTILLIIPQTAYTVDQGFQLQLFCFQKRTFKLFTQVLWIYAYIFVGSTSMPNLQDQTWLENCLTPLPEKWAICKMAQDTAFYDKDSKIIKVA